MDTPPQIEGTAGLIAVGVSGLVGAAFWLRRMMAGWAKDGVAIERAEAEKDLLANLRDELKRLAEQNGKLATSVNSLQLEVGQLQAVNAKQERKIAELQAEIDQLRAARA